eukprot:SAG11_NODE_2076_length_3856_cov_15.369178_1_plen_137_part_00
MSPKEITTWEPVANLCGCADLVEKFEIQQGGGDDSLKHIARVAAHTGVAQHAYVRECLGVAADTNITKEQLRDKEFIKTILDNPNNRFNTVDSLMELQRTIGAPGQGLYIVDDADHKRIHIVKLILAHLQTAGAQH